PKLAFRAIEKAFRDGMEAAEGESGPNPMMPTADAIFQALQLGSIGAMTMAMDFQQDSIRMKSFMNVDYDRGVGRLASAYISNVPQPGFVPENVASLDSLSFDIGAFWKEFEQILMTASPMAGGMYQGYLAQIQQATGVDLRQGLINNLGPSIVT